MKAIAAETARRLFRHTTHTIEIYGSSGVINITSDDCNCIFATWDGVIVAILEYNCRWKWVDKCPYEFAKQMRAYAKELKEKFIKTIKR